MYMIGCNRRCLAHDYEIKSLKKYFNYMLNIATNEINQNMQY